MTIMTLQGVFLFTTLAIIYGLSTIEAGMRLGSGVSDSHIIRRRGYATPEDISSLERQLNFLQKSTDSINDVIKDVQAKLVVLTEKRNLAPDWYEKLQSFERKLDVLQRSQEEQDSFGNKLTALEFTLNHVLSKVVYLSDNIQMHATTVDPQRSHAAHPKNADVEILARLNDLLRHVQSIKRNDCRRSSLPAAAGPVATKNTEKLHKSKPSTNKFEAWNNTLLVDELAKKIVHRLGSETLTALQELPYNTRKQYEQLEHIVGIVKQTDKRLEQWSNEDLPGQQSWQSMAKYCQDVSDEFSSFAGNSDALLKRIESFLRDIAQKIGDLPNKRKTPMAACVGVRNSTLYEVSPFEVGQANATNTAGFDSNYDAMPNIAGCHELTDDEHMDGIYRFGTPDVNSAGRDFNTRYCAFATTDDDHGWTVIQRRGPYDVQENFNRSWVEYRDGFGELSKDFWFGNEFIHRLTANNNYELLIELENFDGGKMSIGYGSFSIGREHHNYSLFIGDYKGPGPDSLSYHNFMDFSTYDRNNNKDSCCGCAVGYGSGWWFDSCLEANLNGVYKFEPLNQSYVGIIWEHWLGDYSLKASRMLVRPKHWALSTNGDESSEKGLENI